MPRPAMTALLLAAAVAAACGARSQPPYAPGPIDFTFAQGQAERRVSALRGRPLVLALVRTSELTSELYLDQLRAAFERTAGETRYLVLSIEPNEAPFLAQYVAERELPFDVGLAEWAVAEGTSALGRIPIVPTTYLIGPDGAVVDIIVGAVPAADLERALARRRW